MTKPADREAEARERILREFESVCPGIIGNPYIPHWPTPPQQLFLGAHLRKRTTQRVFECLYGGAAGGGKLLYAGEMIPTPSGFRSLLSLSVGDVVFGRDGLQHEIQGESELITAPAYRLRFDDGAELIAHDDHRWLTFDSVEMASLTRRSEGWREQRRHKRVSEVGGQKSKAFTAMIVARNRLMIGRGSLPPTGSVRTTSEIVKTIRTRSGRTNHAIPVADPLELVARVLPIDPYVLGLWLGDGTTVTGAITTMDHEIVAAIEAAGYPITHVSQKPNNRAATYRSPVLYKALRSEGLIGNKHVPNDYLWTSKEQRLALLCGLMDTDGCTDSRGMVEFGNTNKNLVDSVAHLLRSLGHKVTVRETVAKLNGRVVGPFWRIHLVCHMPVFRLPRKLARQRLSTRRTTRFRFIVSAERVGPVQMKCLSVSSPDHLFLAGEHMIPTHNSDAILSASAQYAWKHGEFACICFRRTFMDLALPGALMDRALEWWGGRDDVHWSAATKTFTFASGAKVSFGYLQHDMDHLRYKGAEFHQTNWDELTDFPLESQYAYVGLSRVRRAAKSTVPLRTLSASNPGGPGHTWVKARFIGDPEAGVKAPNLYIPARIRDNPHIDQDAYEEGLMHLHPTTRAQLLDGDWRARDPGDYFRAEWFGPLLDPATDMWPDADCIRIRWWDLAASEKEGAKFTSGVRMARHRMGVRAIEHCRSFQATPGKRDDLIVQTAQADGFGVIVGIEIEGGSGGPAQFEALSKRLREKGYRVVGARPRVGGVDLTDREKATMIRQPVKQGGKAGRADPVASCLERGYQRRGECPNTGGLWWGVDRDKAVTGQRDGLRLFHGAWTQAYLDILEGFPDGATCDEVDATSGGWAYLEAHPFGFNVPPREIKKPHKGNEHTMHPADRHRSKDGDKDKAGRWRP